MNSVIGRYLLAVVIGGGVFAGLTYFNSNTPVEEAALPAIPAMVAATNTETPPATAPAETAPAPVTGTDSTVPAETPPATDTVDTTAGPADTPPAASTPANAETATPPAVDAATATDTASATPPAPQDTQDTQDSAATPTAAPAATPATAPAESVATDQTGTAIDSNQNQTNDGSKPTFDVVRVDNSGTAVIAGKAEPNSTVTVTANDEVIGETVADASGEFVAIVDTKNTGTAGEAQNLALVTDANGEQQRSDENIVILPVLDNSAAESAVAQDVAPTIVKTTPDAVVVVQQGGQALPDQITIDSISYEESGEVSVAGRGTAGDTVMAYVNGDIMAKTGIADDGTWKVVLDGLEAGKYTLRVDEIDATGAVSSRMETPFQRAFPSDVRAAQDTQAGTYTVQPGNSLWVIATGRYGEGLKYHQIFAANRDKIRDPDLIYPGQVFVLPPEQQ